MANDKEILDRVLSNQVGIERNEKNLQSHERECAVRYQLINQQLEQGNRKFDRLELMLISMYPFIIGTIVVAEYVR